MLREALGFPRNRKGATRDLLIGGALVLTSPLLIPALLLYGYLLRVMNTGARARGVPPAFGDWGRLLVDGLKAVVVVVAWGLLPSAVLTAGAGSAVWYVLRRPPNGEFNYAVIDVQVLALIGVVVASLLLLWVVLVLHLPAALVALATQGRLRSAFHFGALWSVVSTKQYVVGCLLAVVVSAIGGVFAIVLSPVLVGLVLYFYVQVVVAYVLGRSVGGAAVTAIRPVS